MIRLPTDFQELLNCLNTHHVKYMLVGGYAVGYYGYPRTTDDLDLWIEISDTNARRLVDALIDFGFEVPSLKPDLFLKQNALVRLGRPPLKVELLTTLSGVEFGACYPAHLKARVGELEVPIIGLEDLMRNKKASGRHKDLGDLEQLEQIARRQRT